MEIVHVAAGGDYDRYEELTFKKDQYEKEAGIYYLAYIREFGELATEAFKLKIDCIALKKEIAIYIKAKNFGENISPEEVEEYLKTHMSSYYEELADMIEKKNESKKQSSITYAEAAQIKKKYRKLAKLLHPDISPLTIQYPELSDLFNRITIAYRCNDLKEIEKLEILVNKFLEENSIKGFDLVIPDLEQRIEEIELEIDRIINSIPYIYKKLLSDENAIEDKKKEFREEIDEYTVYKKELSEKLKEIKESENNG